MTLDTNTSDASMTRRSQWINSHLQAPHLVPVDVVQSIKQHLHDLLDFCQGELDIGITQQSSQVVLTKVKHQIDAAFVSVELSSFEKRIKQWMEWNIWYFVKL